MRCSTPFLGKSVLFSGDCRQILPVIPGGSRAQIVHACIRSSWLFPMMRPLRLHENLPLSALRSDPQASRKALEFQEYLLKLGENKLLSSENGEIDLPDSVHVV
eukprot:Pompholyxophrys_sp_v1_NODE_273_length_894_cov_0.964286.p1 type:complete len:104 gc:universal NODE_273_length_894_cov_0.964286:412-101(-)